MLAKDVAVLEAEADEIYNGSVAAGASAPPVKRAAGEDSAVGGMQSVQSAASSTGRDSAPPPQRSGEDAQRAERAAWRALMSRLLALRGDRKVDSLLAAGHGELPPLVERMSVPGVPPKLSLEEAKIAAKPWFAKGLKGKNRQGAEERALLCTQLTKMLKGHAASLCDAPGAAEPERLQRLLKSGPAAEEGPLIASLLQRELTGSRYEGLWITRMGPGGRYLLGDDHPDSGLPGVDQDGTIIYPQVRVVVGVSSDRLVVDGFYHEGELDSLNPARVPIGPFLTVYFEGRSLKEALAVWKDGAPPLPARSGSGSNGTAQHLSEDLRKLAASLPPGWELRESRSKKGTYFFCNPSKGLSQMERPRA